MADVGTCGWPLKTRPCGRAPLWPGGRCKGHGYGAETLEEWVRGIAKMAEDRPLIRVNSAALVPDEDGIVWPHWIELAETASQIVITWWVGRKRETMGDGHITPDDAAVLSDMLDAEGLGEMQVVERLRKAVNECMRAKMQIDGATAEAQTAAGRLCATGLHVVAVDDAIVVPRASIGEMLRRMGL